ncbi:hypothetical protein DQ354_18970, partial [Arthrobacter sp. AQ5-06]
MRVSPETIYQSLYVQSRGALKRDLTACLRTGRAMRQPCRKAGQRKNRIPGMINISGMPPEVQDRAVPGHWESQCCCQAAWTQMAAAGSRYSVWSRSMAQMTLMRRRASAIS